MPFNHSQLVKSLGDTSARWKATEQAANAHALGYLPGENEHPLHVREAMSAENYTQFMAVSAPPAYPPAIDWRHMTAGPGGIPQGNYVTPVRDQGNCGSCVAFGTAGCIESAYLINATTPGKDFDLSEAHLFYCHEGLGAGPAPTCGSGWYPTKALQCCQNVGVVDEKCFPYTAGDQPCHKCADWQHRLTKITSSTQLSSTADMKSWLATRGPVITGFTVYEDFDNYSSGIYHHTSGGVRGGHCVLCVGYDDAAHCWICKNSWRPSWGEQGFFRIGYGQCGIDALMWGVVL